MNHKRSILHSYAPRVHMMMGLALLFISSCTTVKEKTRFKLWYDKPADYWTEALPAGNGRMGAMVFGGVESEHIQFNEETLWTGAPNDYAHKEALPGSLLILR